MKNYTANRLGWKNGFATLAVVVILVVLGILRLEASYPEIFPVALELDGPGENVDDPCFWVNPADLSGSLIFATTKNSGLVEVFNLIDGTFVASIPGFVRPNNCDVSGNLLVTTDRDAGHVKLHSIPDLTFLGTFGEDLVRPFGVDVSETASGDVLVYVTEETDASVHVYDLETGLLVRTFPTGFGAGIEPILVDERHQRVFVSRGENETIRAVGVYTLEGIPLGEFGSQVFAGQAEGLAIYACGDEGYLLVSDQRISVTEFEIFDRVTLNHLGTFRLSDGGDDLTNATDGIDVLQVPLPGFPNGLLAACDGCGDSLPDETDVIGWDQIATVMGLDVCPEGMPSDCITTPCTRRVAITADTFVSSAAPDTNFGASGQLEIELDQNNESQALLRVEVPDLTGYAVLDATLRLTVEGANSSGSDSGGSLFLSTGGWAEDQVTFNTRPAALGDPIGTTGPVASEDSVDFDVQGIVEGGRTYDFLLLSDSANKARYYSRDAQQNPPTLLFKVRKSNPPQVTITSPDDGVMIAPGAPLLLAGVATDDEDGDLSFAIMWRSDLNGHLGQGPSLTTTSLSAGVHTIVAEVMDSTDLFASAMVNAIINDSPAVTIRAPADAAKFEPGAPVVLEATATDPEDGDLTAAVGWTSDLDGGLGTGGSLTVATLSSGVHTVTATVVDAMGASSSSQVHVIINATPAVTVLAPVDGAVFGPGEVVELVAAAVDVEDGDLGTIIMWASDLDGGLGVGSSVATTALASSGTHLVTASVTDSGGRTGTGQITLVIDAMPTVVIAAPASGAEYEPGDAVVLSGTAGDAEDGDLTGVIYWTSDLDGALGMGGSLAITTLRSGTHTITATVTDAAGRTASVAITVVVNATPAVVIMAPANGSDHEPGDAIVLAGTASDVEDGNLTAAISWTSDLDGGLGTGGSVIIATLGSGTHTITAAATDAGGKRGSATIVVVVNATPIVVVTGPASGSEYEPGDTVVLTGTAYDAEDGDLTEAIDWASDLDGMLGTGDGIMVSTLRSGMHTITAAAKDSGNKMGSAVIVVVVNATPTVAITAPASGSEYEPGDAVVLSGTAGDVEDGDLSGGISWRSDLDGALGAGSSLTITTLSSGTHTIMAVVTDARGKTASDTVTLAVNARPVVAITTPASGSEYEPGDAVVLSGTASDVEDGDLTAVLRWTSDLDGVLGTGGSIAVSTLRSGTHAITAAATDATGRTASAAITVVVNGMPTVTITAPASGSVYELGDPVAMAATASDVEDGDLTAALRWTSDLDGLVGTGGSITVSTLRSGSHTISAAVTDAGGKTASAAITVVVNTTPTVVIRTPASGKEYEPGDPVVLTGTASDVEDGDLTAVISWWSDRDGPLGTGGSVAIMMLSSGTHTITATVEDTGGKTANATTIVVVNGIPTVAITAPASGSIYEPGSAVLLTGTASDVEDGDLTGGIRWTSDLDGALGVGGSVTVSTLRSGVHTITAAVTDAAGKTTSATITVLVNGPPTVIITAPADGAGYEPGDAVVLAGAANDAEDGDLTAAITWASHLDGALGTGGSVTVSTLRSGMHTITASVIDADGQAASATVAIVVNGTPRVTITAPPSGDAYEPGDAVVFIATAGDVEDGDLAGAIQWTSDLDGELGSGGTLTIVTLSSGAHTITATVEDSGGKTASATTVVVVSATPDVAITAPVSGSRYEPGDAVLLAGTASDVEDGDLTRAISWTSDLDGELGSGGSLTVVTLRSGRHTITAAVQDSSGKTASATTVVLVNGTPDVAITAPVSGSTYEPGDVVVLTGTASDVEDGDLTGAISWASDLDGALGTGGSVSVSTLRSGRHTITAAATDAGGSTASATITVVVNGTPAVAITTPTSGSEYEPGDPVVLTATANDVEDGDLSSVISWTSNLDGMLGTGGSVTTTLSSGRHTITAEVTDAGGRPAGATITVVVNATPTVTIMTPADGTVVFTDMLPVLLTGTATDPENGDLSGQLVWTSARDGSLGTGASIAATLSPGLHAINATVTDAGGRTAQAQISVDIRVPNGLPEVTIMAPGDGTQVPAGTALTLMATAVDPEEGDLSDVLEWLSDREGSLGIGSVLTVILGEGSHVITARVTDSGGAVATAQAAVAVTPTPPEVTISAPEDGSLFHAGQVVTFGGTAFDATDGDLSGSLVWTSDRDGVIGTGPTVEVASLTPGTHIVIAAVTDAGGLDAQAAVTIVVNAVPELTILAPTDGAALLAGTPVLLQAQATDLEDGELGDQVVWTSDPDGPLGIGPFVVVPALSEGEHTITADVGDVAGAAATAQVHLSSRPATLTVVAEADTYVDGNLPDSAFGSDPIFRVDQSPVRQAFLRFVVTGVAPFSVEHATLRLTVGPQSSHAGPAGAVYSMTVDTWSEEATTFATRPAIDGPLLATHGDVLIDEVVDFELGAAVPGEGSYNLAIVSTSSNAVGYRAREATSGQPQLVMHLTHNTAPAVAITAPPNGTRVVAGAPVVLLGAATDAEDGDLSPEIVWSSDRDGALGVGANVTVSLTPGRHTMSATVTDAGGLSDTAERTIDVTSLPAVSITTPSDGAIVMSSDLPIVLSGTATDEEDGLLSGQLEWTSSRDGVLGAGASITVSALSIGQHTITASVTDSDGLVGTTDITVHIRLPNVPPDVSITAPADGTSVPAGTIVEFAATAIDDFDGDLSSQIAWSSDRGGSLGSGAVVVVTLGEGSHIVTARVTDSDGAVGTSQVAVGVTPSPPTVTILGPADGAVVTAGELVTFSGTAIDATDGDLSAALVWTSDRDGLLGVGALLDTGALTVGVHTVVATATDAGGLQGSVQINLVVDGPPTLTVDRPVEGARLLSDSPVILAAAATDPEDGDIGSRITWTSNLDGDLGAGSVITVGSLSVGDHTLTARVTDLRDTIAWKNVHVSVDPATPTVPAVADTYVDAGTPDVPLGGEDIIRVDASPERQAFLRFLVPDVTAFTVERALLRLTVGPTTSHASAAGGTVHSLSDTTWSEETMTFTTRVPVDGPAFGTQGPVASDDVVEFDVTAAVTTAGARSFAILTDSGDAVGYRSREATSGSPLLVISLRQNGAPFVRISAPASGSTVIAGSSMTLTAVASDPEDGDVSSAVVWRSDVEGHLGTGATVTVVPTPGVHTITAEVTDSGGLRGQAEIVVSVDGPPTVTIIGPTDGQTFEPGAQVALVASAADAEDGDLAGFVSWTSDRDGALGVGGERLVEGLSSGIHLITASVVDSAGSVASDTLTLIVNGAPVVTILTPLDGTTIPAGSPVVLTGDAVDPEDGRLGTALVWSSDLDGLLGNGEGLTVMLSPGFHVITARVSDALGASGTASVGVMANDEAPAVTVLTPDDGIVMTEGEAVLLSGRAIDRLDGDLSSALTWTSSIDGPLGSGRALTVTTLGVGVHQITASAMDSSGQVSVAEVAVTVEALSTMTFDAVADAFVVETAPESRFGGGAHLIANGADPTMETFLRFDVQGTTGLGHTRATVRLTADASRSAGSSSGGEMHRISETGWDELLVTYSTRPPIDGPVLHAAGPVSPGEVVEFDVTAAVGGDGTYVFAIRSAVTDSVVYRSREAAAGNPQLVLLAEADPSNAHPGVVIVSPADGALVSEGTAVVLAAAAADAEDGDLAETVSWESDRDGVLGAGGELLVDGLSAGTHLITASVVDSAGGAASDSVMLIVNGVPVVTILTPPAGTTIPAGNMLVLAARAVDAEDGDLGTSVAWSSDRDGLLGHGEELTIVLSPGSHVIEARVTDAQGGTGVASLGVMVTDDSPVVTILTPEDGTVVSVGEAILLSGQAIDGVDGDLSEVLTWTSSMDGSLGSGPAVTVTMLEAGVREITASAMDSGGRVGTAAVSVNVVVSTTMAFEAVADAFVVETSPESRFGGGSNLIVTSANPTMEAFLRFEVHGTAGLNHTRATVQLTADASSSAGSSSGGEMHAISDTGWNELLVTYSTRPPIDGPVLDGVGPVSPGEVVEFDVTAVMDGDGTYVFALRGTVADSVVYRSREAGVDGPRLILSTGGDTLNAPPEVTILSPADGTVVAVGTAVTFEGMATDVEDGDLTAGMVWSSDIDGVLGTGNSLTLGSLTAGVHRIRGEAADSGGRIGLAEIGLVVSAGPEVTILDPAEAAAVEAGSPVVLSGSAMDAVDGDLSTAIVWSSDRQGTLGTGASLSTTLVGFGWHVLTATVTNSAGSTAAATVTVTVGGTVTFDVVADAAVMADQPDVNFGGSSTLSVDGTPVRRSYLRFVVTGLGGGIVTNATLFLTVDSGSTAGSPSGGDVIPIANSSWSEDMVTFNTSPVVNGPLVASAGPVAAGQVVGLDVSSVVAGDGTYDFALVSQSSNKAEYVAREGGADGPRLVVRVE